MRFFTVGGAVDTLYELYNYIANNLKTVRAINNSFRELLTLEGLYAEEEIKVLL